MNLTSFHVELFVANLDASIDFYTRVLGFTVDARHADGYTSIHHGPVSMALNLRAALAADHPIHIAENERPGRGVEIVLYVDDVQKAYAEVQARGWPVSAELQRRPWGLDDFRLQDPDGYYLRITSAAASNQ
jgi:catechol 2,3-dioxygenase-like lactoylglutathione lyase family enzyme